MQTLIIGGYFSLVLAVAVFRVVLPQKKSEHFRRLLAVTALFLLAFGVVLAAIASAWYSAGAKTDFHWFDDSGEWLQMDKTGHFFTAFFLSRLLVQLYLWASLPSHKAYLYGGFSGAIFHSSIELFDGFEPAYGASVSDLAVNVCGSLFVYVQYRMWGGLKFFSKMSFHTTLYAALRPDMLGNTLAGQSLKDYNGHTIWFTFPLKNKLWLLPAWLHLAIGYGAEGLVGGHDNMFTSTRGQPVDMSSIPRCRQFYLSLDINLEENNRLPRLAKLLCYVANHFKVPMPALEINACEGLRWHWLYF